MTTKKTIFLRTPFNYDTAEASRDSGLLCLDQSLAQQHFKDECDINILFARYLETGEMPQVMEGLSYGNFEGIFDFQTAMNAVRAAEEVFYQLPARIKNRFDNDPQKLLTFMNNPDNRDEAEFLGLVAKPATLSPGNTAQTGEPNGTGTEGLPPKGTEAPPRHSGTQGGAQPPATTEKP